MPVQEKGRALAAVAIPKERKDTQPPQRQRGRLRRNSTGGRQAALKMVHLDASTAVADEDGRDAARVGHTEKAVLSRRAAKAVVREDARLTDGANCTQQRTARAERLEGDLAGAVRPDNTGVRG